MYLKNIESRYRMPIVQITPAYPPDICGVGDYAAILAWKFQDMGLPIETLVARPGGAMPKDNIGLARGVDTTELAEALDKYNRVLLHFSGYGYARRGLCRWLVDALRRWKAGMGKRRLVTMFHEVYATGPVWRMSFWTASPQKRNARDLALLSDAHFVSSAGGHTKLIQLLPDINAELLPVFSNIGEPDAPAPLCEREGRAIVFGGSAQRQKAYKALKRVESELTRRLNQIGVFEITDIGPNMRVPKRIAGCDVKPMGVLPGQEVSNILARARIGFIDYAGDVLTKSGIAAAYFAHRVLIVNSSPIRGEATDPQEGEHFLGLANVMRGVFDTQKIADAGWSRYRLHGTSETIDKIQAKLKKL